VLVGAASSFDNCLMAVRAWHDAHGITVPGIARLQSDGLGRVFSGTSSRHFPVFARRGALALLAAFKRFKMGPPTPR